MFRFLAAGLAVAGMVGCAAGAAGPKSIAVTQYRGFPSGAPPARPSASNDVSVAWLDGRLDITTWGSGSCPAVPTRLRTRGEHAVEVTISADYSGACTADLSATTSVVELPSGVAAVGPLTVTVRGKGRHPLTVTLPRS